MYEGKPWAERHSVKRVTGGMHPVKRVTGGMPKVIHEKSLAQQDEHDENIFESRIHIFFSKNLHELIVFLFPRRFHLKTMSQDIFHRIPLFEPMNFHV